MILFRLLSWLPFPVLYALAEVAYLALYYVAGYRKKVVRENLKNAFPENSERELTTLAKQFYRQLTQVGLEIVKARRMDKADFLTRVDVLNPQLLRETSNNFQQSVIILTIHQGNWEWMLHGITAALGVPLDPVYKPLHNRTVDRLIYEIRSRFGSRPVSVTQFASDILRHRRQFRFLAVVADQSPTRQERTVWTSFMNQQTAFHPGAETMARLTDFPVLFAQCRRRRRGYYEVTFHPLTDASSSDGDDTLTERYAQLAERAIREEPQSWLWSNRRWKRQKPGSAAGSANTRPD
jgi:KDO2-lipid IV(A) lauroyltransferase